MVVKGFPTRMSVVSRGSPSRDELLNTLIPCIYKRCFKKLYFKRTKFERRDVYIYIYTALACVQGLEAAAYQSVQLGQRVPRQVENLQRRQLSQRSDLCRPFYNVTAQIQFAQTFQRAYAVRERGYPVPGQVQNFQLDQSADLVTGYPRHRVPGQIQSRYLGKSNRIIVFFLLIDDIVRMIPSIFSR